MQLSHRALTAALCASALAAIGSAQSTAQALSQPWSQTFGGALPGERLLDLRQAADGSLSVAARTGSFGTGTADGWLLSLTAGDGGVRSESVVGRGTLGGVDGAGLAADGGALFTGRDVIDIFHKHDAWVVRVDAAGAVQWSTGFTRAGNGRHFLMDAAELPDGTWIAAGATSIIDQPPQNAWLVKLTAGGAVDWHFEYAGGVAEWIWSVVPTADGGYAVAGSTNSSGAGFDDAFVMKLDAAGAIVWQRTFGGGDTDQATELIELSGGGFAVAGWTNSFTSSGHAPWVLRLDAQGQLLWHTIVGDQEWGDLDAIAETHDGALLALGRIGQPGFPSNDLWAMKLSAADGALHWQRAYEGDWGDWGSQALTLRGGDLLLGGEWGSGFPEEDLWLVRTDADGRLPDCDIERKTHFGTTSPPVVAQPGVTVRLPGGALLQPAAFQTGQSQGIVEERCSSD